jgi:hypothetical protein
VNHRPLIGSIERSRLKNLHGFHTTNVVPLAAPAACLHHPDREAMGICVRCRVRYCSECITKLDGVNHCAPCLSALAAAEGGPKGAPHQRSLVAPRLAAVLYFALVSLLAFLLLEASFPGSS